ncbi:MAG: ZIP family metal transporter [Gammaproteobacteria bacterium]
MANWAWTLILTGIAALASASGAALLAMLGTRRLTRLVPPLVSFSTGVLLGVACLDLLPGAFAGAGHGRSVNLGLALALGMLTFFTLEKLIHWHHAHEVEPGSHASNPADDRATAVMVLSGTSLHNLLAGVLLAAAVLTDHKTALLLFAAVLAHHIPQQIGDLSVLVMTGMRRARALALTIASSMAVLVGGMLALLFLRGSPAALDYVLVVASASLIYIALADLIPRLRGHKQGRQSTVTVLLVALGIVLIYAVVRLLPG